MQAKLSKTMSFYFKMLWPSKVLFFSAMILLTLMELTALGDKYLLKVFLDNATLQASGDIVASELIRLSIILFWVFASFVVFRVIARFFMTHCMNRVEARTVLHVKQVIFTHILSLSAKFYVSHKTGTLISRMNRAGGAITSINDVIVYNFLPLAVSIIGVLGSLFVLDWVSAVVTVSIIVCFVTFTSIMLAKQLPLQEAQQGAEDSEKAFISDSFTNIESIKLYAKELFMGRRYGQIAHTTAQADVKYNDWYRWIESGQNAISGIGIGAILFVTAYQFLYSDLAVSTIVFTYTVVLGLIAQLYGFNWGLRAITRGFMDLESARSYLDITADIIDEKKSKPLVIKKGSIVFEDMTFSYAKKRVFDSFSLTIPSKKRVAFVGHSGSGKSTLLKLLFRLYNVDSGRILIDGQDIKTVTQNSVRNAIAIVPQECLLFDDTLYQNVLFAREDATREEVMKAMSLAQLDDVLAQLPSGEKTIVGERGVKLSGGEKQRVSLARAILAQRPVLVLDEATSALDSETEHKIQQALAHALQGRTSVIIAHRLSTIMTADVIVVLKHGKIVQMGTHNELVKVGEYKKLWDLQKGGYIS